MNRRFLHIAALMGMSAVILGAFAAHKLKDLLEDVDPGKIEVFKTGVNYQFYHTFALLAVGILYRRYKNKWLTAAGFLFIAGTILFSGSLYLITVLTLLHESPGGVGIITPIGGAAYVAGWVMFFMGVPATKHHGDRDTPGDEPGKQSGN